MSHIDITKCKFDFEHSGKTGHRITKILIDGVEWATAHGTTEGRHGFKFFFRDAAGNTVKRPPPPRQEGSRQYPASSYSVTTKNRAEIDDKLKATMIMMIKALDLRHPDAAREAAAAAGSKRQQEIDAIKEEKRKLWEDKAREALTTGSLSAIIEAMEWAQSQ